MFISHTFSRKFAPGPQSSALHSNTPCASCCRAYLLRKYVAAPRFSPWRRDGTTAQYARRSDWRVGSNKRAALTAQNQDRSRSRPDQDHERVQAVKRADLQKRRRAEPRKGSDQKKAPFVRTIFVKKKAKKSRRRSTLPHSHPCSTIDVKELNFRVRDGIGCGLFAIITGKI